VSGAGFADEEVAGAHEIVHAVGVAENGEAPLFRAGGLRDAGLHFSLGAADDDGLGVVPEVLECARRSIRRPDTERARAEQERGFFGREANPGAPRRDHGRAKTGSIGMPVTLTVHPIRRPLRGAHAFHRGRRSSDGPRRVSHMAWQSMSVTTMAWRVAASPFEQVRDDARGHEVRADGDVGIELLDELDQAARC